MTSIGYHISYLLFFSFTFRNNSKLTSLPSVIPLYLYLPPRTLSVLVLMEGEAEDVLRQYLENLSQDPGQRDIRRCTSSLSSISSNCRSKFIKITEESNSLEDNETLSLNVIQSDGSINLNILNQIYESVYTSIPHLLSVIFVNHSFQQLADTIIVTNEDQIAMSLIDCSIIENILLQLLRLQGYSVILFKDVLHHSGLLRYLPISFTKLCQYLFLPSGLNIRNLIWHGFMSSHEFEAKYWKLFANIRVTCEVILRSNQLTLSFPKMTLSSSTYSAFQFFKDQFQSYSVSHLLSYQSLFLLPTHLSLMTSALTDFQTGRHLYCLLKLLPLLEHSLRFLFCLANELPEYILAQEGEYYSTLDGFGQRSKHQLILDPFLHAKHNTSEFDSLVEPKNQLPTILGVGAYSVLVDLFFSDAGTNLRSQFAHDEINLARLVSSSENMSFGNFQAIEDDFTTLETNRIYLEEMTVVVLVVFFGLCGRFNLSNSEVVSMLLPAESNGTSWRKRKNSDKQDQLFQDCSLFLANCTSHFHPHRMLSRSIQEAFDALRTTTKFLDVRHQVSFADHREDSSSAHETKVLISMNDGIEVHVWEKDLRIRNIVTPRERSHLLSDKIELVPYLSLQNCLAIPPLPNELSVGQLVESISDMCQSLIHVLLEPSHDHELHDLMIFLQSIFIRPVSIFEHQELSTLSTWNTFLTKISNFLDRHLNLCSHLLPGMACCGQICQVRLLFLSAEVFLRLGRR